MSAGVAALPGLETNAWPDAAFYLWLHRVTRWAFCFTAALIFAAAACTSHRTEPVMRDPEPIASPSAPVFDVELGEHVGAPIGQPVGERMVWADARECEPELQRPQ